MAVGQLTDDEELYARLDAEANSVAILVQHLAGNLVSRWTDFLSTDGEKPGRNRDAEFELHRYKNRQSLFERWNKGFALLDATLSRLSDQDVTRSVVIRGEAFTVVEAITRSLLHVSFHVGQIVLLCKHSAGPEWTSMSIPRGESANASGAYKKR